MTAPCLTKVESRKRPGHRVFNVFPKVKLRNSFIIMAEWYKIRGNERLPLV